MGEGPNRPLTKMEREFCRAYVRQGCINATKAALAAGYAKASAHVTGCRLLKRADILDEIANIRGDAKGVARIIIAGALEGARKAREARTRADPAMAADLALAEADVADGLDRAYVVAGLIDNYEICLGRRSVKTTKLVKQIVLDDRGTSRTETVGVQVGEFRHDSAGANRAGELLMKELDRIDGVNGTKPEQTRERSLNSVIAHFRDVARGDRDPPE